MIYGAAIEKELISFEVDERNGPLQFRVTGEVIYTLKPMLENAIT